MIVFRRSEKWRQEMADEETRIFIRERKKKPLLMSEVQSLIVPASLDLSTSVHFFLFYSLVYICCCSRVM